MHFDDIPEIFRSAISMRSEEMTILNYLQLVRKWLLRQEKETYGVSPHVYSRVSGAAERVTFPTDS
jgi:hypothetical protein